MTSGPAALGKRSLRERCAALCAMFTRLGSNHSSSEPIFMSRLSSMRLDCSSPTVSSPSWTRNVYGSAIREAFTSQGQLKTVIDFSDVDSFETSVDAYPHLFVFEKDSAGPTQISSMIGSDRIERSGNAMMERSRRTSISRSSRPCPRPALAGRRAGPRHPIHADHHEAARNDAGEADDPRPDFVSTPDSQLSRVLQTDWHAWFTAVTSSGSEDKSWKSGIKIGHDAPRGRRERKLSVARTRRIE